VKQQTGLPELVSAAPPLPDPGWGEPLETLVLGEAATGSGGLLQQAEREEDGGDNDDDGSFG
jgi:hypothetical protein